MWVKICGIRDAETASAVAALRPDAVGLNFFRGSVRAVTPETAASITRELPAGVDAVGVFVNPTDEELCEAVEVASLHGIQFHGDESPQRLAELLDGIPRLTTLRAFRVAPGELGQVARYLDQCRELGVRLDACLVDSAVPGSYGGTGHRAAWEELAGRWPAEWPRLVLAGGLRPENVADAARRVRPWGVDVASGVESAPGVKDAALVERFLRAARASSAPATAGARQG